MEILGTIIRRDSKAETSVVRPEVELPRHSLKVRSPAEARKVQYRSSRGRAFGIIRGVACSGVTRAEE
jgi:hypothetical protein